MPGAATYRSQAWTTARVSIFFAEHREVESVIEDYRKGTVPLIVPVTLIRHQVRAQAIEYLAGQSYLEPHPRELALRNHV